jgi:3-methyladenine DNA glycosylase AlkC
MQYHSDWDGAGDFRIALKKVSTTSSIKLPPSGTALRLPESLIASQKVKVNLNDAHALKVLCDLYIQKKAQQFVNQRRKALNSRS